MPGRGSPEVGAGPRPRGRDIPFQARQETRLKDIEASLSRSGEKSGVFSELEKALKDPSILKKKNPLDRD
jgi:hypothetical protein